MRVGSLFSGIGGIDLGLQRAGMEIAWQIEIDPFCQKVLAKHWPDVPRYGDIKTVRGDEVGAVDIVAGGFPCQPVSLAGQRAGQSDERWLWPEFARILRVVRPRYVLVENTPGLLSLGMGSVLRDLADIGFDAEWQVLSAKAVGAPHLRRRVFIVAYRRGQRMEGFWQGPVPRFNEFSWCQDVRSIEDLRCRPDIPQPLLCGGRNGIPHYVDRLRALGNAVVPQVVEQIGRAIMAAGGTK